MDREYDKGLCTVYGNRVTVYSGKAGTGKTTKLRSMVKMRIINARDRENAGVVIIAPTHTACQVIKNMLRDELDEVYDECNLDAHIYTVHKFFNTKDDGKPRHMEETNINYLFVDEISMLNYEMFKAIMHSKIPDIMAFGDQLQLPSCNKTNEIDTNILWDVGKYFAQTWKKYPPLDTFISYANNAFFMFKITPGVYIHTLETNHRSNNEVLSKLDYLFEGGTLDVQQADISEMAQLIESGHIFIASKWMFLQQIHSEYVKGDNTYEKYTFDRSKDDNGLTELYVRVGDKFIANDSKGPLTNGFIYTLTEMHDNKIWLSHEGGEPQEMEDAFFMYLSPSYTITVHKSQGQSIDDTIICVDDLFEPEMLYTAISRSRNSFKLISFKGTKHISFTKGFLKRHKEIYE